MENIQATEPNVVIQLNGVSVDLDVIAKDAEIEMNNNEAIKGMVDKTPAQEMPSNSAEKMEKDEPKMVEPETTGSMNTLVTDNGSEDSARTEPSEGEVKVVQPNDEYTKDSTESSSSGSASIADSMEETMTQSESQTETGSSGTLEKSPDNSSEKIASSASSEQSDNEPHKEETVSASTTPTESETPSDAVENNDANETMNSDSSKKSPKKKSLAKKRKNRAPKKEFDYSKFVKYTVSISQRQRRYFLLGTRGGNVPVPGDECEIFCTNIPINVLEGELIPLFERYGKIWELRLMMSMRTPKRNAGFAFVRFTSGEAANQACEKLNNYEILPGKMLSVRLSQPNLSLFVGNIHRGLTREQIHEKISNKTTGLVKTFVKSSLYEETKNCGFCFLEYDSHSDAMNAKRLLNRGYVWGRQLFVDWAQRRKQLDDSDLHDSNTLFINYLPKETTEDKIKETLSPFGTIEKVTKIKDYAFILFTDHEAAAQAMSSADKMKLGHENVEISLAMPKSMKARQRPSFNRFHGGYNNERNGRPRSFKRFNSSFGSSTRVHMRHHKAATNANANANETNAHIDSTGAAAAVEQTAIPIPSMNAPKTNMPAATLAH